MITTNKIRQMQIEAGELLSRQVFNVGVGLEHTYDSYLLKDAISKLGVGIYKAKEGMVFNSLNEKESNSQSICNEITFKGGII